MENKYTLKNSLLEQYGSLHSKATLLTTKQSAICAENNPQRTFGFKSFNKHPIDLRNDCKGPSLFNHNLSSSTISQKPVNANVLEVSRRKGMQVETQDALQGTLHSKNLLQYTAPKTLVGSSISRTLKVVDKVPSVVKNRTKQKEKKDSAEQKRKEIHTTKPVYDETHNSTLPIYDISLPKVLEKGNAADFSCDVDGLSRRSEQFEHADGKLMKMKRKELDDGKKIYLINLVSIVLMQQPDFFREDDKVRQQLMQEVNEMATIDPEFILKLALYTRKTLNLRLVTNFLLAYSAFLHETRPYLKKYFAKCIGLPTDWVKVAELYQTFFDKSISSGALPSSLRISMVAKFREFDEYQLGKYNKEKPAKITFHESKKPDGEESVSIIEPYTLKKLVRKLHINEPAYHIMCIIGKKYPSSSQEFYQARLNGIFDDTKAGQRMKLATPETWETQVSLKGNKAQTWQDLIDHKKLPFMAMLRNLRNMLIAGVEPKYHKLIIQRLTDQRQVVNSKQMPFRFLSSYEVLDELETFLNTSAATEFSTPNKFSKKKSAQPIKIASNAYSVALLRRYKTALNTALKISTIYNIPPIRGKTLILIYYNPLEDEQCCASTKGFSKQRTVIEMCILLGLMCKFHCEDSQLILIDTQNDHYIEVEELNPDAILENVSVLQEKLQDSKNKKSGFQKFLNEFMMERKRIDIMLNLGGAAHDYTNSFMKAYRKDVNPSCLNVTMALTEHKSNTELTSKLDVHVCGFSESILMYIAEVGNGNQLNKVENIDYAFGLHEITVKNAKKETAAVIKPIERPISPWQNIRVFISSTFKDMHGERDLLTRFVFPELRARCFKFCLNLYEVDLRWGITQKQSEAEAMELCLREVNKADLFIGLLGERYGWIPDTSELSNSTEFRWLKRIDAGTSMTELEMRCFNEKVGATEFNKKAMFYARDNSFMSQVPKKFVKDFGCDDLGNMSDVRLKNLKHWLHESGANVSWDYPCNWGGVLGNKPMVSGLEKFGRNVLNNLWNAIDSNYLVHAIESDHLAPQTKTRENLCTDLVAEDVHFDFAHILSNKFIGRKKLIDKTVKLLSEEARGKTGKNLLMITGKSGAGKTAFLAKLSTAYCEQMKTHFCSYFFDAAEDQQTLVRLLYHIFEQMNIAANGEFTVPDKYSELKKKLEDLFKTVSKTLSDDDQYMIFIDSLDKVQADAQSLTEWIPLCIPKGIILVISCTDLSTCQRNLSAHKQLLDVVKVGDMDHVDRASFVRQFMFDYGKELSESAFDNQMKYLLSKKDSSLPLYLQLACDELRMYGIFEGITTHIKTLPSNIIQMIEFSLTRMEAENGESLMNDALSLLFFSRQGLNEEELFDTMNMMGGFRRFNKETVTTIGYSCFYDAEYLQQKLPYLYFMRLCRSIDTLVYKNKQTGVMKLIHKNIRQLVEKRYIVPGGKIHVSKTHIVLAGLYKKQSDPTGDLKYVGSYRKAFVELPYHLSASGVAWGDLRGLLCSLSFIQAKVDQNMSHQLLEDYQVDATAFSKDVEVERKKVLNHSDVIETKDFLSKNLHIISTYPSLLIQQAINSPDESYIRKCARSLAKTDLQNVIVHMNKQVEDQTCSLTISQKESITSVSVSNDDSLIACGMADGQVVVYDKETTKEVKSFIGHSGAITSCCFLGLTKLCSSSDDATISIWDLSLGKRLHVLNKHTRSVSCCKATKDGKLLLSTSLDNTAKLWNTHDGSIAADLPFTSFHPFNCVCFDPQEKNAALGSWNQIIVEWNILENKKAGVFKGHSSSVKAVAYSPSGLYLASASMSGEVIMWSTTGRTIVGVLTSHSSPLNTLAYTPSGLQLVGGALDSKLTIWAGTLGTPGNDISPNISSSSSKADYALCVSVEKDFVAVGYNSGAVIVYNGQKTMYSDPKAHSSSVRAISFMKISRKTWKAGSGNVHLITASDDCSLKRWSLANELDLIYTMKGHAQPIKCMAAKEAFIVSGSEDFTLRVWKGLHFENDKSGIKHPASVLRGHSGPVACCDISSCETMAISGSGDKTIILWDLNKGSKLCTVGQAHADGLTSCSWSNLGNYFVTGSNDFLLKLWDAKFLISNANNVSALKEKTKFVGHVATINDVKYKYGCIVSAAADGSIKVWTHKGIEITTNFIHAQRINSCDIYANVTETVDDWSDEPEQKEGIQQNIAATKLAVMDNLTVFTASDDGLVSSFMPFKPNLINEVYGHSDTVTDVSIGNKKSEVVSSSVDRTVKVWDSMVFTRQISSEKHAGEVSCLAAYDLGKLVASAGYDGAVHVYEETCHKMSFNASRHAIKGVGFLSSEYLVIADALGNVSVWNISLEKVVCSMSLNDFVQSLAVSEDGFIAVSCFTQFKILEWIDESLVLKLHSKESKEADDKSNIYEKLQNMLMYPMSSMVFLDKTNMLLSTENYEMFHLIDYGKLQGSAKVKTVSKDKFSSLGKSKRSEMSSAATCVAYAQSRSKLIVLIGNANGTISFNGLTYPAGELVNRFMSKKVHDDSVTGILYDDDKKVLVTASKDSMIKIWRFLGEDDSLQQIGLYHSSVPVTKLIGFIASSSTIIFGDKSGNVNFLKVIL